MINQEFINLVEKRYKEIKAANLLEDYVDKSTLGEIKIYIGGDKPRMFIMKFTFGGDVIFVGSRS